MLPSVHLPKKTNVTLSRLHKLTQRYEYVRPKTQGQTREKMADRLAEMQFFSYFCKADAMLREFERIRFVASDAICQKASSQSLRT